MKKIFKNIRSVIGKYIGDTSGATAVVFAIVIPVLVAAVGLAVDMGQAYNVKNRLGNAVDKAALAVAGTTGDIDVLEERMEAFIAANYPEEKIGTAFDVEMVIDDQVVTITAHARVDTKFMRLFGKDQVEVYAFSEVTRELSGLEVVLVLDVTGSMAGSNITALKTASNDFLEIMFDRIEDEDYLKIGLVPYSSSVNVGSYGWGEKPDGTSYGTAFVVTPDTDDYYADPSTIEYNIGQSKQWHGCVLARDYPLDTEDEPPVEWQMYRYPRTCYRYGWQWVSGQGWVYQCTQWYSGNPNTNCPATPVVPLTNNRTTLEDTINALNAQGHTYGNIGMAWGGRLISPEEPFTEGEEWDDPRWRKAIVMMTDGNNTMHPTYSAYGKTSEHSITPSDLNDRLEETCENIKANGVRIYTVTFQSGISASTKTFYRNCASDDSMYFDAPTNDDLVDVFQEIANQLSKLHISK
jgi:Flp pilus assembly protein TadG